MATAASVLQVPVTVESLAVTAPDPATALARIGKFFRSRWVYISTVSQLETYSERTLQDMGVTDGVEEFARRAAGL